MNKVTWFNGRELTPGDLDAMQTAPETLIGRHAALSAVGHISGVRVTAVDLQGRAIVVPAAVALDLSTFVRPSTGRYRWLSATPPPTAALATTAVEAALPVVIGGHISRRWQRPRETWGTTRSWWGMPRCPPQ